MEKMPTKILLATDGSSDAVLAVIRSHLLSVARDAFSISVLRGL